MSSLTSLTENMLLKQTLFIHVFFFWWGGAYITLKSDCTFPLYNNMRNEIGDRALRGCCHTNMIDVGSLTIFQTFLICRSYLFGTSPKINR